MPGTMVSVLTSSVATARRSDSGRWTASIACASLGPTPLAVWTSSNICFSSSSAKPNRVRESSRTTMLVGSVASAPVRSPARVSGVQCSSSPTPPTSRTVEVRPTAATRPRTKAITDELLSTAGLGGLGRHGCLQAVGGAAAPDVADGQRERVGGVGGARHLAEPEQAGDHGADLGLVGAAAAGDRRLDLARRVQRDREPTACGHEEGDAAGLGGAHHRLHVVLAEDPLDRDRVGCVRVEPLLETDLEQAQPLGDRQLGAGAYDAHVDQRQRATDRAVDHADAAPGQPGVDPQHAHASPPGGRPNTCSPTLAVTDGHSGQRRARRRFGPMTSLSDIQGPLKERYREDASPR